MTPKEMKLAASLLTRASDEFSNHGCNDLDSRFIAEAGFTDEEKVRFVQQYILWNGDPEMYGGVEAVEPKHFGYLPDWCVMSFLAAKLRGDVI